MALFQGFLDMLRGKKNVEPNVAVAISDDGTGDPIPVGQLSPLRADPTTGALLVSSSGGGGGGGGTVDQGTAGSSSWKTIDDNSAAIKTAVEATNTKLPSGLTVTSTRLLVDPSGVTQPVSGTFYQATQPVSGTFFQTTQPVNGTVAATQSGAWNVTNVSGTVSLPTGASTAALQGGGLPSALISNRLDGNIGSWFGATTPTVGAKTMAASIPVVIASDQTQLPAALTAGGGLKVGPAVQTASTFHVVRLTNDGSNFGAIAVQGQNATGGSTSVNPVVAGGIIATTTITAAFLTDGNGNQRVVGPGATTAATSVSVVPATITSTSAGAITPSNFKLIKGSAGRLRAVRVIHGGATPAYLQVHDVASTGAVTSSTMVEGLTVKLDGVDISAEFDFRASPHSFAVGCVLALSSTRDTYTATVNTAQFYAQWE